MPPSPALKLNINHCLTATGAKVRASAPAGAGAGATVVLALLRGYKILISPLFTGSCRFQPSCADYMRDAVASHGALRGMWLGMRRLVRCHPFGGYGIDPVPPR
jgi:hypothetical protein